MNITVQVRRKKDRPWYQLYYVDPLTGHDRTRSAKSNDLKEARLAAARWQVELESNGATPGLTSWEVFRLRFKDEHLKSLAKKTRRAYATALNQFERIVGKPRNMAELSPSVMSQFRARLLADLGSVTTVRSYLRHVLAALAWAGTVKIIREVPKVKLPKLDKDTKAMRGRPITAKEFEHLLATARKHRAKEGDGEKFVRVLRGLLLSGLRISELVKLSWDQPPVQLDLDGARHPRILLGIEGHKGRRNEILPVTPDFAEFIGQTPASERKGSVFGVNSKAERVVSAIGKASRIVVNSVDGKCVSAHDLRRSFATYWSYRVRPLILQRLMRHRNIETTLAFYVAQDADDIGDELLRAATVPPTVPPKGSQNRAKPKTTFKKLA
jgi:integrase